MMFSANIFRARLVADFERVAKPRVVTSRVRSPLRSSKALVRHRRAHLDDADGAARNGLPRGEAEQVANGLHGGRRHRRDFPTEVFAHGAARLGSRPITSVKVPPRSTQKSPTRL